MKNLIEEIESVIEELKAERQKCFEEIDYPLSQVDKLEGRILAYTDVVMGLNQYNIITAPKTIMLSEIVEKLKEIYVEEIVIKDNGFCGYVISIKKFTGEDSSKFYMNDFIVEIDDGEIFEIYAPLEDNTKWLYALWIAGTEIVDDLAGDE